MVEQEDTPVSKADAQNECEGSNPSLGTILRSLPEMTPEEKEEQRRSFAYGNLAIDRPDVTREDIDRAAERLDKKHWYFVTCDYCPVCSGTDTYRERRYDARPEKWEDRHKFNERYCNCPL
jgi:hypothetical protein